MGGRRVVFKMRISQRDWKSHQVLLYGMVLGISERLAALAKLLITVSSKRYEEASIQPAGKSINSTEV